MSAINTGAERMGRTEASIRARSIRCRSAHCFHLGVVITNAFRVLAPKVLVNDPCTTPAAV
jgi:hypothetical protein